MPVFGAMLLLPLTVLLITHPFTPVSAPQLHLLGEADGYSLRLSDTSLTMRDEAGASVAMRFPRSRCAADHDHARCGAVFPGIDLSVYRNGSAFEYDWIVKAGSDPSLVRVSFTGIIGARIGSGGDLILQTSTGEVRHERPFAYQLIGGVRRSVCARFHLSAGGELGFDVGTRDKRFPLVIDPALSFVSGLGAAGSGFPGSGSESATGVALDSAGDIFITGTTQQSATFPQVNPSPLPGCGTPCFCPAVFAAKISPDGKTTLYSTVIATGVSACVAPGKVPAQFTPPAITVDTSGNAYITGDFPAMGSLLQTGGGMASANGPSDAFVIRLDPNGNLLASVIFGGSGADAGTSIAFGPDGKLYVAGTTGSPDFPVTSGAFSDAISSSQDVFLMRIDPASLTGNQAGANTVLYSTFLAQGSSPAVTADASGNAYVGASTTSASWPVTSGVLQPECAGRTECADVVAAKVNPAGSRLLYATYFGGSGTETIGGIALDGSGNLYFTGTTNSSDFPFTSRAYIGGFDPTSARDTQTAFAAKLNTTASALGYATLLNGEGGLTGNAIAIDSAGNAYVAGSAVQGTDSTGGDLPFAGVTLNAIQQSLVPLVCYSTTPDGSPAGQYYCPQAGFLAALNATGSSMSWATYLGSGVANALIVDNSGNATVAGNGIAMRTTAASPSPGNSASVVKIALNGTSLALGVEDAAQFAVGMPAPGGLAALYVSGVGTVASAAAPGLPLPTQLGGFSVSVDGVAAPLLAVAGNSSGKQAQVNFQVPFDVSSPVYPAPHIIEADFNGQSGFIAPEQTPPGIFTLNTGPAIQHASDYSIETPQNPVHPGETVIIYATGLGPVTTPVPSGTGATGPDPVEGCDFVSANAGRVLYAGLTPGFPGLYQVNVQLSADLPLGTQYIYLQNTSCWFNGNPPFL